MDGSGDAVGFNAALKPDGAVNRFLLTGGNHGDGGVAGERVAFKTIQLRLEDRDVASIAGDGVHGPARGLGRIGGR